MAAPIPVANYGRDPEISEAVRAKLLPDYDSASSDIANPPSPLLRKPD